MQESTKFLCNHNCDDILHCFGILMIWYQLVANQKCTHYAVPMFLDVWHWHLRSTCRCLHLSLMLEKAGIYTSLFMLESSDVDWIMGNHERSCRVMVSFFYLLICQVWKGWWLERPSTHHATYSRMKGREEVVPEDQSVRESSEKWQRHHAATNCFYFPLKT